MFDVMIAILVEWVYLTDAMAVANLTWNFFKVSATFFEVFGHLFVQNIQNIDRSFFTLFAQVFSSICMPLNIY